MCYWHSHEPKTRERFFEECRSGESFEGVSINGLDLSGLDLNGANLRCFYASRCVFDRANLSRATMTGAVFQSCSFMNCNLDQIYASFTKLIYCNFECATMKGSQLLAADLSDSSFQGADLRDAFIGLGLVIFFPGLGNPDRHRTRIDGANFKGADFRGIQLDPVYRDAENLREPLKRVWLYEVESRLEATANAATNDEKKKTLEALAQSLLGRIDGVTVRYTDKRRRTDEIDIIAMNKSINLLASGLAGPIFAECKNEQTPVSSGAVRKLAGSIPHGGIGLMVTTNSLSKDAEEEMQRQMLMNASKGIRMSFWDRSDLEAMCRGEEPEDRLIERYYHILSV